MAEVKGEYFYQTDCEVIDVIALEKDLHPDDQQELIASGSMRRGEPLRPVLERCIANSAKTYAIRCSATDLTMAIGGYTEHGHCWFLSSDWLMELWPQERADFRKLLMMNLMNTLELFPVLSNMAWERNTQHLKLIESCGGHVLDRRVLPTGEAFMYFEFRREDYIKPEQ